MDRTADDLVERLINALDETLLGAVARVCKRLCTMCRQVRATQLHLEGDQGKQLFLMPSTRGFPACSCMQYTLSGSKSSHSSAALFAIAHAALHMPALHALKINMAEETSEEGASTARQELSSILSACSQLQALRDLAVVFDGQLAAVQVAAAAQLTGLTALQLNSYRSDNFTATLHPQLTQLTQLRQLRLAGVIPGMVQGAAAGVAAACLPNSLTGLTFTIKFGDEPQEAGWAQQLQQCSSLCSLEVQLQRQGVLHLSCELLQQLASLPPGTQQSDGHASPQAVVLPALTQLVFKADAVDGEGLVALPSAEDEEWLAAMPLLFPSLQSLQLQPPRGTPDLLFLDCPALAAFIGCSQQLRDLGWLNWCEVDVVNVPGLSFPQLTSLRMHASLFQSEDIHLLFPGLKDLTLGYVQEDFANDEDAVQGLMMCTGLTRLAMQVVNEYGEDEDEPTNGGNTAHFYSRLATGLPGLRRLQLLFDEDPLPDSLVASWVPKVVAAVAALTQLTHLQLGCKPFTQPSTMTTKWQQRLDVLAALQYDRAQNLQLALAQQLPKLHQLQELVLSDMAGISAAVVSALLAQLPSLKLLQLEGCSEKCDIHIMQQQWADVAEVEASPAAARLQQLRAGLREGVRLLVTHSSWTVPPGTAPSYW